VANLFNGRQPSVPRWSSGNLWKCREFEGETNREKPSFP